MSREEESGGLSRRSKASAERFVAIYNRAEKLLRKLLRVQDGRSGFSHLVDQYQQQHEWWADDASLFRRMSRLRNVIVHETISPRQYIAVPSSAALSEFDGALKRLRSPPLATKEFGKVVETLQANATLADTLKLIAERDFSQFPVYESGRFRGLLTENGITRWIAGHARAGGLSVSLTGLAVRSVLRKEKTASNVLFLDALATVGDVRQAFIRQCLLEAVLLTERGTCDEHPIGIATRWDLAHLPT